MKTTVQRRRPGRVASTTALAALALSLVLSGCNDAEDGDVATAGGETSAAGSEDAAQADGRTQMLEFTQCLRENGMDIDDPAPGEGLQMEMGPGDQAAIEECRHLAPEGGTMGGGSGGSPLEDMTAFAECMRENGVEAFPDPDPQFPNRMIMTPEMGEDPDFEAAHDACADHLQGGGPMGGGE